MSCVCSFVCVCVFIHKMELVIESDVVTWVCRKIQIMLSFIWSSKNRQSRGVGPRSIQRLKWIHLVSISVLYIYISTCMRMCSIWKKCPVRRFQHLPTRTMLTSRVLQGNVKNSTAFDGSDEHSCTIHWHNLIYLLCWHDVCK